MAAALTRRSSARGIMPGAREEVMTRHQRRAIIAVPLALWFAALAWALIDRRPEVEDVQRWIRYLGLVILIPGGIWVRWSEHKQRVWNKRFHRGHCLGCGYDLRSTPDRCPECGRSVHP
jgi:hypothetical protein